MNSNLCYPFMERNKHKPYHFYVVLVYDDSELNESDGGMYNGVTITGFVADVYIKTLPAIYGEYNDCVVDPVSYEYNVIEYDGTWDEMIEFISIEYNQCIEFSNWLELYSVEEADLIYALTDEHYDSCMEYLGYQYKSGMYYMDSQYTNIFCDISKWCGILLGDYVNLDVYKDVKVSISRLWDCYVPLLILSCLSMEESVGETKEQTFYEWFTNFCKTHDLPDQLPEYQEVFNESYEIYMCVIGRL